MKNLDGGQWLTLTLTSTVAYIWGALMCTCSCLNDDAIHLKPSHAKCIRLLQNMFTFGNTVMGCNFPAPVILYESGERRRVEPRTELKIKKTLSTWLQLDGPPIFQQQSPSRTQHSHSSLTSMSEQICTWIKQTTPAPSTQPPDCPLLSSTALLLPCPYPSAL